MDDASDNEDHRARTQVQVLATATRVLTIEGRALLALSAALPPDFPAAVERMLACRGRIVVSGIGKSGHIARKIAAAYGNHKAPIRIKRLFGPREPRCVPVGPAAGSTI